MAIPFPTSLERAPTAKALEAMRLSEEGFEAAIAQQADDAQRPDAWRRGHQRGVIFRQVAIGEALGFVGQACRCRRCKTVHWGMRSQCCVRSSIEYGALIKTAETGDGPAIFMTTAQIRGAKLPLIDITTGEPIGVEARQSAA